MRQNDIEKIIAYQKCFIGPLVWKCFTNNFELLLSEKEFPTFCTFFMYINVHGHQIFAKCTLNECTKMELDPPYPILFQMTRGSFSYQIHCSRPNGSQVTTQNVPKNRLVPGDIWGSSWLLVIMNGPINQKLK